MEDMLPDTRTRREMLEAEIAGYKKQGFKYFIDAEAAKVQRTTDAKATETSIRDLEQTSRNLYASAKRLQQLLDELGEEASDGELEAPAST